MRAGERAQEVKMPATKSDDLSSIPWHHMAEELTSKGYLLISMNAHKCATHTHTIKFNKIFFNYAVRKDLLKESSNQLFRHII